MANAELDIPSVPRKHKNDAFDEINSYSLKQVTTNFVHILLVFDDV